MSEEQVIQTEEIVPKKRGRKPKAETPTEVVAEKKEEMVSAEVVKSMQEQIANLHALLVNQGTPKAPIKPAESIGRMRYFQDGFVINFGQAKRINGVDLMNVTVLKGDGTEEVYSENYLEFITNTPSYRVDIKETIKTPKKEVQGGLPQYFVTRSADSVHNKTSTGEPFVRQQIVLEHTTISAVSKVKFLEGPWKDKELTVNTDCINK